MSIRVPELGWVDTTRPETMVNASAFTAFTGIFNTTGHPAMSVPRAPTATGCPIGVQFVGAPRRRGALLRLAAALEAAAPWPTAPVVPATAVIASEAFRRRRRTARLRGEPNAGTVEPRR